MAKSQTSKRQKRSTRPPVQTAKRTARKFSEAQEIGDDMVTQSDTLMNNRFDDAHEGTKRTWNKKYAILAILVVALAGLFLMNRGLLVAGMVNGRPIFRWELNNVLVQRFGVQTLEGIISEKLIAQEAVKEGVTVAQDEIDKRTEEILQSFGGDVDIDQLLSYQGLTREDFENQIRTQLYVEKILGKDVAITESDIDAFIATNSGMFVATEESKIREEARQAILEGEIGKNIQGWYENLKNNASILRYIE